MGRVFSARHLFLETVWAVKVLAPRVSHNRTAVDRFLREARTLAALAHEHVVRVSDGEYLPEGDRAYFVMELLDGEDLQRTLMAGPMAWPRVRHIMHQICATLAAVHRKGVIHRDLKPANCFRMRHGDDLDFIKIVDFGLAKLAQPDAGQLKLSDADPILGTPSYASPEQLDHRDVDARSDIWSAGATMYHLLTGSPPYPADTFMNLVVAVATTSPIPPSMRVASGAFPHELDAVVLKALSRAPSDRYQSMDEFLAAIDEVPENAPVTHPTVATPDTRDLAYATTLMGSDPPVSSPYPPTPHAVPAPPAQPAPQPDPRPSYATISAVPPLAAVSGEANSSTARDLVTTSATWSTRQVTVAIAAVLIVAVAATYAFMRVPSPPLADLAVRNPAPRPTPDELHTELPTPPVDPPGPAVPPSYPPGPSTSPPTKTAPSSPSKTVPQKDTRKGKDRKTTPSATPAGPALISRAQDAEKSCFAGFSVKPKVTVHLRIDAEGKIARATIDGDTSDPKWDNCVRGKFSGRVGAKDPLNVTDHLVKLN